MKRMEGRQGRRFSLINLRSSSLKPSKSVSLSPTVTVLSPSVSTPSAQKPSSSSSTSQTVTHSPCSPQAEASCRSPMNKPRSLSPTPPSALTLSSPTLQIVPSSTALQLVSASPIMQRAGATSSSPSHLQLVSSSSTLQLLPASPGSSTLQIVPTSSATLQLVPVSSRERRTSSSSTIQRIPSTSTQQHITLSRNIYAMSQISGQSPRSKAPRGEKSTSKSKTKKIPKNAARIQTQCPHTCPHSSPICAQSSSTDCLLEETHMSKKEILTKYRLHIFVSLIFLVTLLFVSLGWYYRDKTREEDLTNQKIFIDPRNRILTLSDHYDEVKVLLGQDLPRWQLPLHCPVHTAGNPNFKECVWKGNAVLRVQYFVAHAPDGSGATAQCYNVSWETLRLPRVPYDCVHVGSAEWYGPSNQSAETLPIRGTFDYVPTPYKLSNGGVFSSVVDLYWLSSTGVGLLLNANDPVTLHWNSTVLNHMCVVSNYTGPLYGHRRQHQLPHMNYTICNGPDPLTTHLIMKPFLRGSTEQASPKEDVFLAPQWSVSAITRKREYDEEDVKEVAGRIKMHALNCSLLMLDGDWQKSHGDLTFDPPRFSNLTNMTNSVHSTCALGLQVSPYFDYRSVNNFHDGVAKELFVKDAGGDVPGLTRWQNGAAVAMLDVSRSSSRAWFNTLITRLMKEADAKALRVSYGTDGWLPYKPTFDKVISLHKLRQEMAEMVSKYTDRLVMEHTAASQSLATLMAVPTDIEIRDGRYCLVNAIEKALTLGLLGYPYVLADGFSVPRRIESFPTSQLSQDLFTRWMQMAVFFPAFKFSVAPWRYDESTVQLARNLSKLHLELIVKAIRSPELRKDTGKGLPIMRPVWWLDPANGSVHQQRVNDEFLIGDSLLVAPVLCEGVTKRTIYVPQGVWSDKLRKNVVLGPKVLEDYRVDLNEVPYFERMPLYEETME